jgi:CheY-like chemotaxis protein
MQKIAIWYDASQAVMSTFDLDEVLAQILSIVRDYFSIGNAAVLLYDPDAREMLRGSETVLLVEDEGAVRESLRRILERAGYGVIEARHVADALLLWRERRAEIALVLTDLLMPEMRGGELAAAVRAMAPDAKIIFMSGYASESARSTVSAGDVLLTKPFDADTLLRAVRDALDELVVVGPTRR